MVPFYLSGGDPRKDYNFIYVVGYNPISLKIDNKDKLSNVLNIIFNSAISAYVSLLAEKVTLPSKKISYDQVSLGNVKFPYVLGYDLGNITVQYLEDALGLVNWFHSIWQNAIRPQPEEAEEFEIKNLIMGGSAEGSGMLFREIGNYTGIITYAPTRRIFVPTKSFYEKNAWEITPDLALTADVYPTVFPVDISVTPGDKSGNNLSRTTVEFIRVPNLDTYTATALSVQGLDKIGLVSRPKNIFH